ncbi:hypothetical protein Tco_1479996, partial [Tanacetum coccineum]
MERAATIASSFKVEQDNGNGPRCQDTILGVTDAQTRFETVSIKSNDLPLSRVNTLGSGEDSLKLIELMAYCTKLSELTPTFAVTHNLVAFLEKPAEFTGFEQIIDFLNAKPIKYALTVNPTVYTSCIKKFWATAKVKKVSGQDQIQSLVDKQKVIITEESIRRDIHFDDAEASEEVGEDSDHPTDSNQIPLDTQPSISKPQKKQKPMRNQRQSTEVPSITSEIPVEESVPTPSNDPLPSGEDSFQLN